MKRRGVSLIEAVLSLSLLAVCLLVFLSVTMGGLRESTRSREQLLADQLLQNTCEEILGERFGDPNRWWGDGTPAKGDPTLAPFAQKVTLEINLEGRAQETVFYRRVERATDKGTTGAFFGAPINDAKNPENYDVVKISLDWVEATGPSSQAMKKSKVGYLTVWRGGGAR